MSKTFDKCHLDKLVMRYRFYASQDELSNNDDHQSELALEAELDQLIPGYALVIWDECSETRGW
jgi:hypothetical protein